MEEEAAEEDGMEEVSIESRIAGPITERLSFFYSEKSMLYTSVCFLPFWILSRCGVRFPRPYFQFTTMHT